MSIENLVPEQLRAIRGSVDRLVDDMREVKQRLGSLANRYAGLSNRLDRLDERLSRIERRLDPVEG